MSDDDKLTAILLQVGETKGKVSGMCDDLAHIKGKMSSVVTRTECTGKHKMMEEALARTLGEVKQELRQGIAEIKQKTTGQAHPAITPEMLRAAAAAPPHDLTPEEMEAALAARAEDRAEKRRKLITWYLGTAVVGLGLLGTIGTFVWKTVLTLDKVQQTMASQPTALRREIEQAAAKQQKVVYVRVPVPQPKDMVDGNGVRDDDPRPAHPPPKRIPTKRPR